MMNDVAVSMALSPEAAGWVPNQAAERALAHTRSWIEDYTGRSRRAEWYAGLSAWVYPEAPLEELELVSDVCVFFRVFDDFTDYRGVRLSEVHRICDELVGVRYGAAPVTDLGRMFADLWRRQCKDVPGYWIARAGQHWEWYFATQASYVALRDSSADTRLSDYLIMRHGNGAVPVVLDLGERANGTFIPARIYHSTQLRALRRLANDAIVYRNDIYSSVRDRAHADPRNLVAFTERRTGCSREEAVAAVRRDMVELDIAVAERRRGLGREWDLLGFCQADRGLGTAYARIIHHWHVGYQAWAVQYELLMDTDPPQPTVTELLVGAGTARHQADYNE